jgi:hypothetical protein
MTCLVVMDEPQRGQKVIQSGALVTAADSGIAVIYLK